MKFFSSIIFFLVFQTANGQNIDNYFKYIYQAEDALLDNNFSKGVQYFEKAFSSGDGVVFLKDVHNALLASNLARDTVAFYSFAELMVTFDTKSYISNLEDKLDYYFFQYLNSLESSFEEIPGHCNFFKKLYALDQGLRRACLKEGVYPLCVEEIRLLDSVNLQSVIRYLTNHGLIKEVNRCKMNPTFFSPIHLVVLHNSQRTDIEVFEFLFEEIFKGSYHPQEYAYLIGRFKKDELLHLKDYGSLDNHLVIMDRLFVFDIDSDKKEELNKRRNSIFLDDIESYHRKITYQFFKPEKFYFVYPTNISRLGGEGDLQNELIEKFKEFEVKHFE
jgi:hypothetical protein